MGLRRFFFGRKYKLPPTPRPRWMHVLMAALFLYAAVKSMQKSTPEQPNELNEAMSKVGEAISKEELSHTLGTYKNILFPRYASMMDITDVAAGKGQQILCGQEATIAYTSKVIGGKDLPYKATSAEPLVFRLGDGSVIPALEQGVTGMRVGAKRSLSAASNMSYGIRKFAQKDARVSPDERVQIDVELLGISPEAPDAKGTLYRILSGDVRGKGYPIFCGETTKLSVTVWDIDGKQIFSNKNVSFTPGKSEVFFGLEQAVIGMLRGEKRTLIVPPSFQNTLRGNAPTVDFSLPKEQTVLVDIEALP
ncbi:MAG: hypothetical protein EBR02_03695 [Alphaproteobacteria bacterium]|nr:hypothetical protein [Alphaproteobacteria bacterium]